MHEPQLLLLQLGQNHPPGRRCRGSARGCWPTRGCRSLGRAPAASVPHPESGELRGVSTPAVRPPQIPGSASGPLSASRIFCGLFTSLTWLMTLSALMAGNDRHAIAVGTCGHACEHQGLGSRVAGDAASQHMTAHRHNTACLPPCCSMFKNSTMPRD